MCDRRIAIDFVGSRPEKQIARLERVEFERIFVSTQNRVKISRLTQPDVLLTRVARHTAESVLLKYMIDEAGAIHSPVRGISGAIIVVEILFG